MAHLVRRQQFGMILAQTELPCHFPAHFLAVAREHHGLLNTQLVQLPDSLCTVVLHLVVDDDMARILSVDRYMDDGACVVTVVPFGTHGVHQFRVAHAHQLISHSGTDALSSDLLHVRYLAAIGALLREGIAQGCADGVGGEVLHMGRQMQQLVLVAGIGMDGCHGKLSVGQRARLVEDHCVQPRQRVHVVGALDEDALARGAADAAEEGEGHADDQGAGTADDKEHQGAVEPGGDAFAEWMMVNDK